MAATALAGVVAVHAGASGGTLTGVITISAGYVHTCAVASGQALCWGRDTDGRLGNGGSPGTNEPSPVAVKGVTGNSGTMLTDVEKISAGGSHTCAIVGSSTKQALCWGTGGAGQLGNGATPVFVNGTPTTNRTSPVAVWALNGGSGSTLTGVTEISAGEGHTCAIVGSSTKQALCWGENRQGQLGNGATTVINSVPPTTNRNSPVAVLDVGGAPNSMLTGVERISAGFGHSCAMVSGQALCWGAGANGRLGSGVDANGNLPALENSPVAVLAVGGAPNSTLMDVDKIAAGGNHTCAVYSTASITKQALCWGAGGDGRLGIRALCSWGSWPLLLGSNTPVR